MKNKKLLLTVLALAAVIAVFLGIYVVSRPETSQGAKTFTVTVVHSDGSSKDFTYHTDEEYLGAVLLAEGLIDGDMGDFGLFIKVVDGEEADYEADGAYWAFYQGGDYAMQGIDLTPVNDGDTFRLEYTVG